MYVHTCDVYGFPYVNVCKPWPSNVHFQHLLHIPRSHDPNSIYMTACTRESMPKRHTWHPHACANSLRPDGDLDSGVQGCGV